jgi:lysine biosynthesis protein LysW
MAKCPECESDLELDGYELDVGESINCPECSIELKVTGNDPISVSLAPRSNQLKLSSAAFSSSWMSKTGSRRVM